MQQSSQNPLKIEILSSIDIKVDYYLALPNTSFTLQDKIGLCVMFAYKYKYQQKEIHFKRMKFFFDSIVRTNAYEKSDIVHGPSALLWLIKFLRKMDVLDFSDIEVKPIEKIVSAEFEKSLLSDNWDYFHGGLGHALALSKPMYYKSLLDYFIRKIKKDDSGNYVLLSEFYTESTNLGLHAGILGILSTTNMLIFNGLFVEEAKEIQKRILNIIFKKLNDVSWDCFPALLERDYPAKMCWAYGELSLAVQLYISSVISSENWLQEEASQIALLATKRNSLDSSYILDSSIINGSVGNYLLYKYINQMHPCTVFNDSEYEWLILTAGLLNENDYQTIDRTTGRRNIDLSILTGLSGIYLSVADFDSTWNEYVLLPNLSCKLLDNK
jgi:hypothetical protein